jgi:hypothetical protein
MRVIAKYAVSKSHIRPAVDEPVPMQVHNRRDRSRIGNQSGQAKHVVFCDMTQTAPLKFFSFAISTM